MSKQHEVLEKNIGLMAILIVVVVSIGGIVEIVPLIFSAQAADPAPGVVPDPPLVFAGRDVYVREGCYNCHSQMVRPFRAETERYGPFGVAGEYVYDRPFQWGSKRTGPDLARVGGRYSDDWHRIHLLDPRDVVPESNMPAYPWLAERELNPLQIQRHMRGHQRLGVPYTDEDLADAVTETADKTELDALIAYLQSLTAPTASTEVAQQ